MASWRVKGYVSDSEDDREHEEIKVPGGKRSPNGNPHTELPLETEDKGINFAPNDPASYDGPLPWLVDYPGNQKKITDSDDHVKEISAVPTSTAEKLQRSLAKGLELVQSVLSGGPIPLADVAASDTDSPLSSPPDTPRAVQTPPKDVSLSPRGELYTYLLAPTVAPVRSLRQRTANQLHPYTIEQAKYLRECDELGIRPVRVPQNQSLTRTRPVVNEEEYQLDDQDEARESISQDPVDLDNTLGSSLSYSQGTLDFGLDDELPDLAALLKRGADNPQHEQNAKNSQRLYKEGRHRRASGVDEQVSGTAHPKVKSYRRRDQESFPSPPASPDSNRNDRSPLLQIPPELDEYNSLPTPILSSTSRPRRRLVIEDDTQSGDDHADLEAVQAIVQDTRSIDDNGEHTDSERVQVFQKRIRGVLPASWWTVEKAQQQLVAKRKSKSMLSNKRIDQAGVAQRRTRIGPTQIVPSRLIDLDDLVSDEELLSEPGHNVETSDTEERYLGAEILAHNVPTEYDSTDIVVEEDIDPMLAPRHRAQGTQTKRDLNSKLKIKTSHRGRPGHHSTPTASRALLGAQRSYKRRRARSTRALVHVLDAPDLQLPKQSLPPFLRLAARQVKSQPKSSGFPLSRKFFDLDASTDEISIKNVRLTQRLPQSTRTSNDVAGFGASRRSLQTIPQPIDLNICARRTADHPDDEFGARDRTLRCGTLQPQNDDHRIDAPSQLVGQPDDAILRLTRLRSLLPLKNRSGLGQLMTRRPKPREVQAEVLQSTTTMFAPYQIRVIGKKPMQPRPQPEQGGLKEGPYTSAASKTRPVTQHRHRKQEPVHHSRFRQISLIGPLPDSERLETLLGSSNPKVRAALETEFVDFQGAWFQGSKSGITVANEKTQGHFQLFLEVLQSYLPLAFQDLNESHDVRELRSFLHRLIPNRGQIGASGQVGDKKLNVLEYDVLVARNVFELHKCLLSLAPGSAPQPRVLEMKVNFTDAHEQICKVAISAWKAIYDMHHVDLDIVRGLANWMYSMIQQTTQRWLAAEIDARREASTAVGHITEEVVRSVINYNRSQACTLLSELLTAFVSSIEQAVTPAEAQSIFDYQHWNEAMLAVSRLEDVEFRIVNTLFETASAYITYQSLHMDPNLANALLAGLRQALARQTTYRLLPSGLLQSVIQKYFTVAEFAVRKHIRSWDDFITPVSSHSFDMFAGQAQLDTIKGYFLQRLVEQHPLTYAMAFRPHTLTHWIKMLLQAREDDTACRLLTKTILRQERESLSLFKVSQKFDELITNDDDLFPADSICELQYAVVLHVITELSGQEADAEADWLIGGFELSDADVLLKTIFTTLKDTWKTLELIPERQDIYTLLIHAALRQVELYPRETLMIDPWFFNPATFPQPVKAGLAQVLGGIDPHDSDMVKSARGLFAIEVQHARRFFRFTNLAADLKKALTQQRNIPHVDNVRHDELLINQAEFMVGVFSDYTQETDSESNIVRGLLLDVLNFWMDDLECCIEDLEAESMEQFINLTLALLPAIRSRLMGLSHDEKELAYQLAASLYRWGILCLGDVPYEYCGDFEAICDAAAIDGSRIATMLLETVMSG